MLRYARGGASSATVMAKRSRASSTRNDNYFRGKPGIKTLIFFLGDGLRDALDPRMGR